jgi:uncharacterized membrane protein
MAKEEPAEKEQKRIFILWILSIFKILDIFWLVSLFVLGAFMLVKGFGVDKTVKNLIQWIKEYSPPPLPVQISNYSTVAGVLCIVVGTYLGSTKIPIPTEITGWISDFPRIAGFFIQGSMDLIVLGVCVVLLGRAIQWYFKHDIKLLRNAALIVTVAWSRWILEGTADVLITPGMTYEKLIFSVIVGILIGIASVLVVFVIHRSARGFFKKTEERVEEFGEG